MSVIHFDQRWPTLFSLIYIPKTYSLTCRSDNNAFLYRIPTQPETLLFKPFQVQLWFLIIEFIYVSVQSDLSIV